MASSVKALSTRDGMSCYNYIDETVIGVLCPVRQLQQGIYQAGKDVKKIYNYVAWTDSLSKLVLFYLGIEGCGVTLQKYITS